MRNFFHLWCDYGLDGYADFDLAELSGIVFFTGRQFGATFSPPKVVLKPHLKPPDYLGVGSLDIVSARLRHFLEQKGVNAEFIEVELVQGDTYLPDFYYMNPLDVIACLDTHRSVYSEFAPDAGGGILRIHQLYLDESKVGASRLFVLEEKVMILVREDLMNEMHAAKFTGLAWKKLPKGPF